MALSSFPVSANSDRLGENLSGTRLAEIFAAPAPLTVGLEEEIMVLDPATLHLAPIADRLLEQAGREAPFKGEMPAAQLEILTEPAESVADALAQLADGRRALAEAAEGRARFAVAGVHPFSRVEGELSTSPRYDGIRAEYGRIARRQLVSSLQVHVAVGDAERTLRVYNGLRNRLPELAALAANAPFQEGDDTGLASIRPKIAELLPRQGVPPPLESWDAFAGALRWGAASGAVAEPRLWWWELRPNAAFGTLEVRVPDAQTTLADAGAIAATVHALAAWLAERGGSEASAPTWRIEENRWSAARHGVEGEMADLTTGEREPTRIRLTRMLDELDPIADRLGGAQLLQEARRLVAENGALRQHRLAAEHGVRAMTASLADAFLEDIEPAVESPASVLPPEPTG